MTDKLEELLKLHALSGFPSALTKDKCDQLVSLTARIRKELKDGDQALKDIHILGEEIRDLKKLSEAKGYEIIELQEKNKNLEAVKSEAIQAWGEEEDKVEKQKAVLNEIKKRYDYLNEFKGIRKEWHNRVVEEFGKILAKLEQS